MNVHEVPNTCTEGGGESIIFFPFQRLCDLTIYTSVKQEMEITKDTCKLGNVKM